MGAQPVDGSKLRREAERKRKDESLDKWFGMKKAKMTPELEKELKALKLRAHIDPKRFYKGNDSKELPKYFAVATEVGGGMAATGYEAPQQSRRVRSFIDSVLRDQKSMEWTGTRDQEVMNRGQAASKSGHGKRGGKSTNRGGAWKQ